MSDMREKNEAQDTGRAVYKRGGDAPKKPEGDARPIKDFKPGAPSKPGAAAGARRFPLSRRHTAVLCACVAGLLAVVLFVVCLASCNRPVPVVSSSAPAPVSSFVPQPEAYDQDADRLDETAFVGTILPQTEDAGIEYAKETLFLGDSNTARMLYYHDITGVTLENGIGIESMGITSYTSQQCVQFEGHGSKTMPEAVKLLQPRRVVITFGTNNVGMNIDTFIASYEKAIAATREAYKHADIIIGGIFPVDQYRQNTAITMQLIDKMNNALADLASKTDCKFLNWGEAIRDEETGFSGFEHTLQDGVHLTRTGMQAIFDYFRTHSYVTEDTRPPVTGVPKRIGVMPGLVTTDPRKVPGPIDWEKVTSSGTVSVVFSAWDAGAGVSGGGTVAGGGLSGSSVTLTAKPGETTTSVQALPDEGYQFSGWACSVGSIASPNSAQLPGFTVDAGVAAGTTITVTARFTRVTGGSSTDSSISSIPSSSSSSSVPSSSTSDSTTTSSVPSTSPDPSPGSSEAGSSSSPGENNGNEGDGPGESSGSSSESIPQQAADEPNTE